jgi:hypothetical protein
MPTDKLRIGMAAIWIAIGSMTTVISVLVIGSVFLVNTNPPDPQRTASFLNNSLSVSSGFLIAVFVVAVTYLEKVRDAPVGTRRLMAAWFVAALGLVAVGLFIGATALVVDFNAKFGPSIITSILFCWGIATILLAYGILSLGERRRVD